MDARRAPHRVHLVGVAGREGRPRASQAPQGVHRAQGKRLRHSEGLYRFWDRNLPMGRVPHLLRARSRERPHHRSLRGDAIRASPVRPGASHLRHLARRPAHRLRARSRRRRSARTIPWRSPRSTCARAASRRSRRTRHGTSTRRATAPTARRSRASRERGQRHTMPALCSCSAGGGRAWWAESWRSTWKGRCDGRADGKRHLLRRRGARPLPSVALRRCERVCPIAVHGGWVQGFDVGGAAGDETIVVAMDSAAHPAQVHAIRSGRALRLESFNDERMAKVDSARRARSTSPAALAATPVQMSLTFPPRFDRAASTRPPDIHGGPYAAAGDTFGYRWNPHVFASRGYVVAPVNYHGSSGFGFAFRDSHGAPGRARDAGHRGGHRLAAATALGRPQARLRRGRQLRRLPRRVDERPIPAGRYRAYVCHAGVFDRVASFSADSYPERPRDLARVYWENPPKVRRRARTTFATAWTRPRS